MRPTKRSAGALGAVLLAAVTAGCSGLLPGPRPGDGGETALDAAADHTAPGTDAATGADATREPPLGGLYGPGVTEVVLEVDYQRGAEPYTGPTLPSGDTWDLFRTNAGAMFAGAPRTLTVPTQLAQMEELADVTASEFTVAAILAIAASHRTVPDAPARRSFYVVWLEGYFSEASGPRRDVLGVSLGSTGVLAMFKPVIRSTGAGVGSMVQRFVEQAVLVHEFGHAAGLVNNGVSLTTAHQDEEHGAHCSNRDCVMYWLNEGTSDMVDFVTRRVASGSTVLFGDECLADTRAASSVR